MDTDRKTTDPGPRREGSGPSGRVARILLIVCCSLLGNVLLSPVTRGQSSGLQIIVHSSCPASSLSRKALSDLFLKRTKLGLGYFTTQLSTYYNQHDEIVGTNVFELLRYGVPENSS